MVRKTPLVYNPTMPELPEVETVVRDLRGLLLGRRISGVRVGPKRLRQPWSRTRAALIVGRQVRSVGRRGKWICVELDDAHYLIVHLGMSGQITLKPAEAPRARHTHGVFDLDDGAEQLRFRDPRRFGSLQVMVGTEEVDAFFDENRLGPEPFALRPGDWQRRLTATQRCLKAALLDQRLVAGVGNIYADESLWEARLHPARRGCDSTPAEAERLRRAIVAVLRRAIRKRGTSFRDFIRANGSSGDYQKEFRVYGQTGRPCPRCAAPIALTRLAGRATHYCPRCQAGIGSSASRER